MEKTANPVLLGGGLRLLVPREFEARLRRASLFDPHGLKASVRKRGLFFDLSRVEWVDLASLMQIVLLVETAIRQDVRTIVALPLARTSRAEEEMIRSATSLNEVERVRVSAGRRVNVRRFMDYLRFVEALEAPHLREKHPNLLILRGYDESERARVAERSLVDAAPKIGASTERLYRYCFPFQWFDGVQEDNIQRMAWFLARMVGQPKRGLESIDAESIANVLLYELVDNVRRHAGESAHALVTAWARPVEHPPRQEHYHESERPYLEWLSKSKIPVIDILIGDSGRGLSSVLAHRFDAAKKAGFLPYKKTASDRANTLLWAFDRWSSSRDTSDLRGTRGLYRVDRVVRKYQGLATVRSSDQLAGWDHGGSAYDEPLVEESRLLAPLPGTIVRLRMPAFREGTFEWRAVTKRPQQVIFIRLEVDQLRDGGLNATARTKLRRAMEEGTIDRPVCVVASISGQLQDPKGIESVIKQAVELRHPATLVLIGLPGGWEAIEVAVNSVNLEHAHRRRHRESYGQEHFEIWDPVLIIGERCEQAWAGVNESFVTLLSSLFGAERGRLASAQVQDVLAAIKDQKERAELVRSLRNDSALVSFREDGGLEARFTVDGIFDSVSSLLLEHIEKGGQGVLGGAAFRTPSLFLVDKWLSVDRILESSCGSNLAMLALSARIRRNSCWQKLHNENILISDQSVAGPRLKQLQAHLGDQHFGAEVIPGETGMPMAYGVHLITRGARVIIYCDIILSGETVRRCLSQALRDEAVPIAVACLFDAREDDRPLEMWGVEVPVVSLVEVSMSLKGEADLGNIVCMNPVTREREESISRGIHLAHKVSRDQVVQLLEEHQALHFSHIGRPIGRHFTFYLDVSKLISHPVIESAFQASIDEWIAEHSSGSKPIKEIELWYPAPEPRPPATSRHFAESLFYKRKEFISHRTIRRETAYGKWTFPESEANEVRCPNVAIVDWGALTGVSVMQMIRLAAEAGAERVIACIFVSQLSPEDEVVIQSIDTLKIPIRRDLQRQTFLPGFPEVVERFVSVSVKFLSSLPLGLYNAQECPVCEQLNRLAQEDYPTDFLTRFARLQKEERLRARTREEVLGGTPKDFDGRELPSNGVVWMVEFRQRLSAALISTTRRYSILTDIRSIRDNLFCDDERFADALYMLQFLSIENQWLRMPPLKFQSLREVIADIALKVALTDKVNDFERLNAIVVLRSARKYLFARKFQDILVRSHASELVVQHVLYDVFTYLSRPYHQTKEVLEPLKQGLLRIQKGVEDREISLSRDAIETVYNLVARVELEYARADARSLAPSQAWLRLRRELGGDYRHPHNPIVTNMSQVLPGPDAELIEEILSGAGGSASRSRLLPELIPWLKSLERRWSPCRRFLDYTVLPLLEHLRSILLSEDGKLGLGSDTVMTLIDYMDKNVPLAESEFSRLLRRISNDPNLVLVQRNWELFKFQSAWFWERIFRPGYGDEISPSRLVEFMHSAPVKLEDVLGVTCDELQKRYPEIEIARESHLESSAQWVFCTSGLVSDVISEAVSNCWKHRDNLLRPVIVRMGVQEIDEETIGLIIVNDNTRESGRPGVGLQRIEKRLSAFEAKVRSQDRPGDGWSTFGLEIHFIRSEEVQ